jgi:hypothetical protein
MPITIGDIHKLFTKTYGKDYDLQVADAVLAVAAANRIPGDPPWLMVISGSGNCKTESVNSVSDVPHAVAVSTIASQGALLSATKKSKGATGGLLGRIGDQGILVIKDFTSIISGDRKARTEVLAGLREVHDGEWNRDVGVNGGLKLTWKGRIVCIAACTTEWDTAYSVVASMGPRFVTIRSSSRIGRIAAGRRAIHNAGNEKTIREKINKAVTDLLIRAHLPSRHASLMQDEEDRILNASDIVTLARTGVVVDFQGKVVDAHEPEMPTRYSKQLVLIFRGALAIGLGRTPALNLALRCARDSIPPIRLRVLQDLADHEIEDCRVADIAKRLSKPWTTIQRTLDALYVLELLIKAEINQTERFAVAANVDLTALKAV